MEGREENSSQNTIDSNSLSYVDYDAEPECIGVYTNKADYKMEATLSSSKKWLGLALITEKFDDSKKEIKIKIIDPPTRNIIMELTAEGTFTFSPSMRIQFSPNEEYLAAFSDEIIFVWDLNKKCLENSFQLNQHLEIKRRNRFDFQWLDNDHITILLTNQPPVVFNIHTGEIDKEKLLPFTLLSLCHNEKHALAPTPSGIACFNIPDYSSMYIEFDGNQSNVIGACFSPTNKDQCICYTRETLYSIDVSSPNKKKTVLLSFNKEESFLIENVQFTQDGNFLLICQYTNDRPTIIIWNIATNQKIHELVFHDTSYMVRIFEISKHQFVISSARKAFFIQFPLVDQNNKLLPIKENKLFVSNISEEGIESLSLEERKQRLNRYIVTSLKKSNINEEEFNEILEYKIKHHAVASPAIPQIGKPSIEEVELKQSSLSIPKRIVKLKLIFKKIKFEEKYTKLEKFSRKLEMLLEERKDPQEQLWIQECLLHVKAILTEYLLQIKMISNEQERLEKQENQAQELIEQPCQEQIESTVTREQVCNQEQANEINNSSLLSNQLDFSKPQLITIYKNKEKEELIFSPLKKWLVVAEKKQGLIKLVDTRTGDIAIEFPSTVISLNYIEDVATKLTHISTYGNIVTGAISKTDLFFQTIQFSPNEKYLAEFTPEMISIWDLEEKCLYSTHSTFKILSTPSFSHTYSWVNNDYVVIQSKNKSEQEVIQPLPFPLFYNIHHTGELDKEKEFLLTPYSLYEKYALLDAESEVDYWASHFFDFNANSISQNRETMIRGGCFSPTNNSQYVYYTDRALYFININLPNAKKTIYLSGNVKNLEKLKKNENAIILDNNGGLINDVQFSQDGRFLFIGTHSSKANAIIIWDIENNKKIFEVKYGKENSFSILDMNKILLSRDNKIFSLTFPIINRGKKELSQEETSTPYHEPSYLLSLSDEILLLILSFVKYREQLITIGMVNKRLNYLTSDEKLTPPFENKVDYENPLFSRFYVKGDIETAIVSPSGKKLAIVENRGGRQDKELKLFDIPTSFSIDNPKEDNVATLLIKTEYIQKIPSKNTLLEIQFSPNGKYLAGYRKNSLGIRIYIWDLEKKALYNSFPYPSSRISPSLEFQWLDNDSLAFFDKKKKNVSCDLEKLYKFNIHWGGVAEEIKCPLFRNQKYELSSFKQFLSGAEEEPKDECYMLEIFQFSSGKRTRFPCNGPVIDVVFSPINPDQCIYYTESRKTGRNTLYLLDMNSSNDKEIPSQSLNRSKETQFSKDGNFLFIKMQEKLPSKSIDTFYLTIWDIHQSKKVHTIPMGMNNPTFFLSARNKILIKNGNKFSLVKFPMSPPTEEKSIQEKETSLGTNPFAFLTANSFRGSLSNVLPTSLRRNRTGEEKPEDSDEKGQGKDRCIIS